MEEIKSSYEIVYQKIFVFSSPDLQDEVFCTYNVESGNIGKRLPNTYRIHRKKDTDTMYTIDGLNALNWKCNGGDWVQNFDVPWSDYRRTLLLESAGELRVIRTRIEEIIPTV